MSERPILFSDPMVRAILEGHKTVTRRPVTFTKTGKKRHFADKGDRLWVREAWLWHEGLKRYFYRASSKVNLARWRPSIFMPREASRITLRVTDAVIQPLHSMVLAPHRESAREGCKSHSLFVCAWDAMYFKRPALRWAANPMVWRVQFERVAP